jgi:hypothetical protein
MYCEMSGGDKLFNFLKCVSFKRAVHLTATSYECFIPIRNTAGKEREIFWFVHKEAFETERTSGWRLVHSPQTDSA